MARLNTWNSAPAIIQEFVRGAMNTIPIIFNETLPSYTVVGGTERAAASGLSLVLLNRGGRYSRRTLFQELEKVGFDYIISLEGPGDHYDVEELSLRFPFIRFVLLKEHINPGAQINLAASEMTSPLFFVLWNDLRILHGGGAVRMAERQILSQEELSKNGNHKSVYRRLCTVPVIQNSRFETLPTLITPSVIRRTIGTMPFPPNREGLPSLYPFDGIGIYDRERFIGIGGFDSTLGSFHWQLMDFGFRSRLWGEEINATLTMKLSYDGDSPAEDSTAEESYRRFYLKNIAPVFRGDTAHIPLRRFPAYLWRTGGDPFAAWEDFSEGRRWVKANCYRFKCDAKTITELWEPYEAVSDKEGMGK
ncbi:hypothetical protein AGMMS49928_24690 [Spirochaetia bacterium]|nr:hypothetical protein AGMMS49928_24690 [Spirochaetia bacterium]